VAVAQIRFVDMAMRFAASIFLAASCASCSTVNQQYSKVVSLPKLTVDGVRFDDGLQEAEAATLSAEYFHNFVSGCGMPDKPQDDGRYWRVKLWGGYVATDYGTLRLAKDGSEALLEPPRGGFKSVTQEMLRYHNVSKE
jgi:hypothetical protein